MITPVVLSITGGILTLLVAIAGFLVKRSVFGEIDALKKELEKMEAGKAGVELCIATHRILNETLAEVRKALTKNSETLQQVQIDLAVVRTILDERSAETVSV